MASWSDCGIIAVDEIGWLIEEEAVSFRGGFEARVAGKEGGSGGGTEERPNVMSD